MVDRLIRSHAKFRKEFFATEKELYQRLAAAGQNPEALVISCSDSRVIPEQFLQVKPGQLFVVRNIANLVPRVGDPAAAGVGAAIEYATLHLGVRHLIVLGHYGCGGLRAAIAEPPDPAVAPHLAAWLRWTTEAVREIRAEHPNASEEVLLQAVVEENVLEQLECVLAYPTVARALDEGRLTLHGWVYNLATGEVFCYDEREERFRRASHSGDAPNAGRVTPGNFED